MQNSFNLKSPVQFLALGFGSGLAPKAPGTFGTLAAVPLFLFCSYFLNNTYLAILILIMSVIGIYLCGKTAEDVGVDDHPAIVWDEFAGLFITLYLSDITWLTLLVGFILFRFFDILKPWPISFIDKKIHGGFGIMLDDIVAGFAAFACMQFIF